MLLPGLDGTGDLFDALVAAAPSGVSTQVIALPHDRARTYAELAAELVLPPGELVLVAESFSGPLAVLLAARHRRVRRLVLCASFVTAPVWPGLARLPDAMLGRTPPRAAVRAALTGGDDVLAARVLASLAKVPSGIVASRVRAVLSVDVAQTFASLPQPVTLLAATRDRLVPRGALKRMRALRPEAQVVELRAPHLVLQSQPHEAWRALLG